MTKKYVVISDRQGGSFGMGRAYTAKEWLDQAEDWLDADGSFGCEEDRTEWLNGFNTASDEDIIAYVSEIWELDFAKCFEYCGKTFAYEIELDCPKDEYPFHATVYQLDDEAIPHAVWDDYYQTAEDAEREVIQTFIESVQEDITQLRKETD